jgi:hypothetical protein
MQISQSTHRQTFIYNLTEDIRQRATDESLSFHTATAHVLLQWLGYEFDDLNFIDDGERGIDAWLTRESGIDVFRINNHELGVKGDLDLRAYPNNRIE